jgi:copper homeostasis protein
MAAESYAPRGLVEVVALHPADADNAQAGGADRLQVCSWVDGEPHAVEPATVSAIVRATDLPVRVTLRLSAGFSTQGGELSRLVGLASDYLALGVEGFSFGFLTRDLEVDTDVCRAIVDGLGPIRWTFDRAFDQTLDARQSWARVRGLPGLDGVHTAGAALGMNAGFDDLTAHAQGDPAFATCVIAAGGTVAEQLPWLVRCGISRVHLGAAVRPGGSWTKAHVESGFVRAWRLLLDDALAGRAGRGSAAG